MKTPSINLSNITPKLKTTKNKIVQSSKRGTKTALSYTIGSKNKYTLLVLLTLALSIGLKNQDKHARENLAKQHTTLEQLVGKKQEKHISDSIANTQKVWRSTNYMNKELSKAIDKIKRKSHALNKQSLKHI